MTGAELRAWRKARKWTQQDLADRLHLSLRTVKRIEAGRLPNRKVKVPKTIELACHSLDEGVSQFTGKGAK